MHIGILTPHSKEIHVSAILHSEIHSTPSLTLGKVPTPKTIPTMDFGGSVFAIFALIWVLLEFYFNMCDGQGSLSAPFQAETPQSAEGHVNCLKYYFFLPSPQNPGFLLPLAWHTELDNTGSYNSLEITKPFYLLHTRLQEEIKENVFSGSLTYVYLNRLRCRIINAILKNSNCLLEKEPFLRFKTAKAEICL